MGPSKKNGHACGCEGKLDCVMTLWKGIPALYPVPLGKWGHYIFTDGSGPCRFAIWTLPGSNKFDMWACHPCGSLFASAGAHKVAVITKPGLPMATSQMSASWIPLQQWSVGWENTEEKQRGAGNFKPKNWCQSVIEYHVFPSGTVDIYTIPYIFYSICNCLFGTHYLATLDAFSFL